MKRATRIILISSVVILLAGSVFGLFVIYKFLHHQQRAKEVVLHQNLWAIRRAIDFYATDKEKQPKSLQDLVDERYLREIPVDPITQSNKTWVAEKKPDASQPENGDVIVDVHSAAAGADTSGKPYNQY